MQSELCMLGLRENSLRNAVLAFYLLTFEVHQCVCSCDSTISVYLIQYMQINVSCIRQYDV
jgi:hypothetical protein